MAVFVCDPNNLLGPPHLRRSAIEGALGALNRPCHRHAFKSVLCEGINLYSPPRNITGYCLLVAHYDGNTFHDNAGGVLMALEVIRRAGALGDRLGVLFTDCEETFQQGAAAFLRDVHRYAGNGRSSRCPVICIDGIGGGNLMLIRRHLQPFEFDGAYFRMDADVFREAGIPAYTVFTGLDCLIGDDGRHVLRSENIETNEQEIVGWLEAAGELLCKFSTAMGLAI